MEQRGFDIVCKVCGRPDGQVATGLIEGKQRILLHCPHCKRTIVRLAEGGDWAELKLKM